MTTNTLQEAAKAVCDSKRGAQSHDGMTLVDTNALADLRCEVNLSYEASSQQPTQEELAEALSMLVSACQDRGLYDLTAGPVALLSRMGEV